MCTCACACNHLCGVCVCVCACMRACGRGHRRARIRDVTKENNIKLFNSFVDGISILGRKY